MNNIEKAAQVIYDAGIYCGECCYGQCDEADCLIQGYGDCPDCTRIVINTAQALHGAGLLMPDLPAPEETTDSALLFGEFVWLEGDGDSIVYTDFPRSASMMKSAEARQLALALTAAAEAAEEKQ